MIGLSSLEVTMIATKHKDLLGESLVTGGSEKVGVVMHRWLWVVTGGSEKFGVVMHRWLWVVQGKLGLL